MHSSRMRTARSSSRPGGVSTKHPRDQNPPGPDTPPVYRHTPANLLPCPKLRLRAVIKEGTKPILEEPPRLGELHLMQAYTQTLFSHIGLVPILPLGLV